MSSRTCYTKLNIYFPYVRSRLLRLDTITVHCTGLTYSYAVVVVLDCTLITREGSITSPNYPSDYSSDTDICWKFTADEGKVSSIVRIKRNNYD